VKAKRWCAATSPTARGVGLVRRCRRRVSDIPAKWWDDRHAKLLGFVANDSSAKFAGKFPGTGQYAAADDVTITYQGGGFLLNGPTYKD
jgi:hypothetical protein